jgi:hypothetical protein
LDAALVLTLEDRAKPMSVSHENIAKTLTHIIHFADAIWYSRIADPSYPVPSHGALSESATRTQLRSIPPPR